MSNCVFDPRPTVYLVESPCQDGPLGHKGPSTCPLVKMSISQVALCRSQSSRALIARTPRKRTDQFTGAAIRNYKFQWPILVFGQVLTMQPDIIVNLQKLGCCVAYFLPSLLLGSSEITAKPKKYILFSQRSLNSLEKMVVPTLGRGPGARKDLDAFVKGVGLCERLGLASTPALIRGFQKAGTPFGKEQRTWARTTTHALRSGARGTLRKPKP